MPAGGFGGHLPLTGYRGKLVNMLAFRHDSRSECGSGSGGAHQAEVGVGQQEELGASWGRFPLHYR